MEFTKVLYIWLNIIWELGWPFIIVPIFLYYKKDKVENKFIFFITGVLVCYTLHILFELASIPFLSEAIKIYLIDEGYKYLKLIVLATTILKLIVSIIVLSRISKMRLIQRKNRGQ